MHGRHGAAMLVAGLLVGGAARYGALLCVDNRDKAQGSRNTLSPCEAATPSLLLRVGDAQSYSLMRESTVSMQIVKTGR